jgi:hypothetical protein
MQDFMEFSTRDRMDTHIYTHIGHNYKDLVFGIGNVQRDKKMGRVGLEVQSHIYI